MSGWLSAIVAALKAIGSYFAAKSHADGRELGRMEQQNADMKEDTAVIRKATEAAKKVEREEGAYDPNDRDHRR